MLAAQQLTSETLTRLMLQRIDAYNPSINCYLKTFAAQALARARELDEELTAGKRRGPLHGVPIALKDILPPGWRGFPSRMAVSELLDTL